MDCQCFCSGVLNIVVSFGSTPVLLTPRRITISKVILIFTPLIILSRCNLSNSQAAEEEEEEEEVEEVVVEAILLL